MAETEDERLVEVMAQSLFRHDGIYTLPWDVALSMTRDFYRAKARATLSALRAEGCEVVRWVADTSFTPSEPAEQAHFSNLPALVVHMDKQAILRGPEVKP